MSIKNRHPLILLLFTLFLTFSASEVYAQDASEIAQVEESINGIMNFPINTSGPQLEYAHLWFKQMLGGFIFAPWDAMGIANGNYDINDQTVLSKALGFTNILAIIICLVIGYYLIVGGAINTAAKGEVLGQNWDGPWLAIRTSIGFGMLVPLKGIGGMTLSFSQVAIIWLIMIGSNSATLLWNMIGESILSGTEIAPSNIKPSYTDVGALASMLVCAELNVIDKSRILDSGNSSGTALSKTSRDNMTFATINYTDGTPDRIMATRTPKHGYFEDSAYWRKDANTQRFPTGSDKEISDITFGNNCGTIVFPTNKTDAELGDDWGETDASSYKLAAKVGGGQAYAKIILDTLNDLLPLIDTVHTNDDYYSESLREMFSDYEDAGEETIELYEDFYDEFIVVADKYFSRVKTEIHQGSVGNDQFIEKIRSEMMYGGWAGAGIWFMELSTLPSIPYQAYSTVRDSIGFADSSVCPIVRSGSSTCTDLNDSHDSFNALLRQTINLASAGNSNVTPSIIDQVSTPCDSNGDCMESKEISSRLSISVSQAVLGWLGSDDEEAMNPFDDETSLVSPFLFLSEIGATLNNASYGLFFGVAILNSVADYAEGILAKKDKTLVGVVSGLLGGELAAYAWYGFPMALLKNSLLILVAGLVGAAVALMSSGFLLAYVIPFMPITTWILMMAGYMLTVVESIAAAPLAIVLLFTPEGSGIAGSRFERALNLVTMAILRPSFMILGLIASITVSFVAFSMMNTFFFKAAEHILTGHLFDAVAITLIYVSLAYQLAKMMVENMHQLPDRIGEWFAGGVSRQFGESRVNDSAEQAVQGASSKFTAMPNSAMSMQGAMRETRNKEKEASKLEGQKE